ncbi:uncharacterized protein V1518DRAFT_377318 [Limtongia smithiae]|uniref:uncharacterized protein n=1 Tax=Limtongia smithiae TaxID=1125753 RepID=UPI0034CF798A
MFDTNIYSVVLKRILSRAGPFTDDDFTAPGADLYQRLSTMKIFGAGGLGCEILKNLALSGFTDIHVIDMDTIDVSNLNRQFLFRHADVGKPKALVAAEFVMARVRGVKITPFFGKIQDKDENYYMQFAFVICGLDSVEARRWINATLVNMVDQNNPESLKPLIDGGTEGFKGQSRLILPTITSCYECSLDMFGKEKQFPICTIANTPRLPEHCIEWALVIEWPRVFPDKTLDNDDPEHIQWIYQVAFQRAQTFKIGGVTHSLTQGVAKHIIPAIASTNAVISASCCSEALKLATSCNPFLSNYMMYNGSDSVYSYTFEHQRKEDCPVCGMLARDFHAEPEWTLGDFIDHLNDTDTVQTKKPSLRTAEKSLYLQFPPQLEEATRPNLQKKLNELVASGQEVSITDPGLPFSVKLRVYY